MSTLNESAPRTQGEAVAQAQPSEACLLAQRFHAIYESLADLYDYKTRPESAISWDKVPEKNQRLMIATCAGVLVSPEIKGLIARCESAAVAAMRERVDRLEALETRAAKALSELCSLANINDSTKRLIMSIAIALNAHCDPSATRKPREGG